FLRGGFRPFFLLAAAWAAFAILTWLCAFLYGVPLESAFTSLAWHRHEMLFGFVGAAIVGFLLTAIPNWTGRLPAGPSPALRRYGSRRGVRCGFRRPLALPRRLSSTSASTSSSPSSPDAR